MNAKKKDGKLLLKRESVRELSRYDLDHVAGGTSTPSVIVTITITIGTITWTLPPRTRVEAP